MRHQTRVCSTINQCCNTQVSTLRSKHSVGFVKNSLLPSYTQSTQMNRKPRRHKKCQRCFFSHLFDVSCVERKQTCREDVKLHRFNCVCNKGRYICQHGSCIVLKVALNLIIRINLFVNWNEHSKHPRSQNQKMSKRFQRLFYTKLKNYYQSFIANWCTREPLQKVYQNLH
jgi:hypothetical protein